MLPDIYATSYIGFDGNAKEAMEFYQSVLGGDLTMSTYGETMGDKVPDTHKDKIMHAMLVSGNLIIMGADTPAELTFEAGSRISMTLGGKDAKKLKAFWEGLSKGGTIAIPMAVQVWGDEFGMVVDKFGVTWMVNILKKEP